MSTSNRSLFKVESLPRRESKSRQRKSNDPADYRGDGHESKQPVYISCIRSILERLVRARVKIWSYGSKDLWPVFALK